MEQEYKYLKDHCLALFKIATHGDPWVFVCASAMIEYLQKMTGEGKYADFILNYLSKIDSRYKDFKYANGDQNLPEQMYFVLRNGLVHSFTLKPNKINSGKMNSILLSHDAPHFSIRTDNGLDACILNGYTLVDDLCKVIDLIYEMAKTNVVLRASINDYWKLNPSIGRL